MPERLKCAECGKDAIGFPSFGCCFSCVCPDHACSLLPGPESR